MADLERLGVENNPEILSMTLHFMAFQDNEIEPMGKEQGLTYQAAGPMGKAGQLPGFCRAASHGTMIVKEIKTPAHADGLYARVSSSD